MFIQKIAYLGINLYAIHESQSRAFIYYAKMKMFKPLNISDVGVGRDVKIILNYFIFN